VFHYGGAFGESRHAAASLQVLLRANSPPLTMLPYSELPFGLELLYTEEYDGEVARWVAWLDALLRLRVAVYGHHRACCGRAVVQHSRLEWRGGWVQRQTGFRPYGPCDCGGVVPRVGAPAQNAGSTLSTAASN
jgi:hypothetical protein